MTSPDYNGINPEGLDAANKRIEELKATQKRQVEDTIGQKEIGEKLPLTEEIAMLRYETTLALITTPRSEWGTVYQGIIEKHPTLKNYKQIFDTAFLEAKTSHDALDNLWRHYQPEEGGTDTLIQRMEVADPEASKQMFESIFGFNPKGQVRAEKGTTTLRFIIDDESFRGLSGTNPNGELLGGALAYLGIQEFPVLVFQENEKDMSNIINYMAHEVEHGVNSSLRSRYQLLLTENLSMDPKLAGRLKRRLDAPASSDDRAKDELLAFFTLPECIVAEGRDEEYEKFVQDYSQEIVAILIDEKGSYYLTYQHYEPQISRSGYVKNVNNGAKALVNLFNVYKAEQKNSSLEMHPARIAINVLEQFPLKSWPAVSRLISQKHKSMGVK